MDKADFESSGGKPQLDDNEAILVYDGDCPFCSAYVRLLRLREHITLHIVNAREGGEYVDGIVAAGFNLDEGMVLYIGQQYFHGDECIHALALMSTSAGVFNRLNTAMFKNRTASRILYPILRFFRNLTLKLLGRKPLELQAK